MALLPVSRSESFLPRIIDEFFGDDFLKDFFYMPEQFNVPAVNVVEDENKFQIEVAAPGFKKEDFKVQLDNDVLTIYTEKKEEKEEKDKRYRRREFNYQSFTRSFIVPDYIDKDKIDAEYKDGILFISLPKLKEKIESKGKEIKIK
ncbi:MAG: Hsp20/alpha crystallin family protein [Bacteroidales bacterium]|jgi:HSP20 family protein|nr:Hsp20/alpha crystallin family protein [Bacteroidales bacterium]MDI9576497.1 Hsp20/alpha crystallin family protein [Bacteroidota bacterium]MDY0401377.1 Hsp20/alpha crystallin family protein [Bacteroidales bacterium]HOB78373.1 Hsp20/alpha crystallin family protein [Bacteroidales bacterium]HPZ60941.1 Hsp20/alpha crystallin family protein [Bacteroidales bacterium]